MSGEFYAIIAVLIIFAIIVFLIRRNQLKSLGLSGKPNLTPVGGDGWLAEMGWRYVRYIENDIAMSLLIVPMAKGNDLVYVPDETSWLKDAPYELRRRRAEILERLKSVEWNRRLKWQELEYSFIPNIVIPGSLESTSGGQRLERLRLFHPGGNVSCEEALERWHDAARMFAQMCKGEVMLMDEGIRGSVFDEIELPVLELNPNVTLIFKNKESL